MKGMVKFSLIESCWVFDCIWGCHGSDFEGEAEAYEALAAHQCNRVVA